MSLTDKQLDDEGVGISHHFGGGSYIKETHIPRGAKLGQHAHDHDHLSVLVSGAVLLTIDGETDGFDGYKVFTIKAGKKHEIEAMSDSVWLCIWATEETDPELVDQAILKG